MSMRRRIAVMGVFLVALVLVHLLQIVNLLYKIGDLAHKCKEDSVPHLRAWLSFSLSYKVCLSLLDWNSLNISTIETADIYPRQQTGVKTGSKLIFSNSKSNPRSAHSSEPTNTQIRRVKFNSLPCCQGACASWPSICLRYGYSSEGGRHLREWSAALDHIFHYPRWAPITWRTRKRVTK